MVKLGKMMWKAMVKANCSRARRTGSKSIAWLSPMRLGDNTGSRKNATYGSHATLVC